MQSHRRRHRLPLWFVERDLARAADQITTPSTSPNNRPGLALIGCGGQGGSDLAGASKFGNVVALCDVKENSLNNAARRYPQDGKAPTTVSDFRKILERKDVDIVVSGTPDHWHSLINIGAARAKKDVYGEKPLTCKEFEATLQWANDIRQIVKTTTADSPFGGILDPKGQRNGIRFTGTEGWIWVNRGDISASQEEIYMTPLPAGALKLEESNNHMANFFDCVRSRKDPVAHVEQGHRSAVIGHLIILAMRLDRKLQWDPAKEIFTGDGAKEADTHLAREMPKPYDYSYVA